MEELDYSNGFRPKELHTIIIWDSNHKTLTDLYLSQLVKENKICIKYQNIITLRPEIEKNLSTILYQTHESRAVNNSLYLILLEDQNPVYKYEQATSCMQVLNYNMFVIKSDLRRILAADDHNKKSIYYYVHTSYNTEETELVLKGLGLETLMVRKCYADLKELFHELNNHPRLKYVVQRSFDNLNDPARLKEKDIDILVNDYYLLKEITGARSKNKILMREAEDGYFIQNEILVGDLNISFDIRYLGDGFLDYGFEKDLLEARVLTNIDEIEFFVPNPFFHLYSLLYSVLLQKSGKKQSVHFKTLKKLYKDLNIHKNLDFANSGEDAKAELWFDLIAFMNTQGYKVVIPKDKTIKLNIPEKYRSLFNFENQIDFAIEKNNFFNETKTAIKDIVGTIPSGSTFILVDECTWMADDWVDNHNYFPFMEHNGKYWGNPKDDAVAIQELKRLKDKGAGYLVLASPAFWWMDYYQDWYKYLRHNFICILENERVEIFDLRQYLPGN